MNPPCNLERITTLNVSNFDFKISIFENLTFLAYISILSHFLMCGYKQAYVDNWIRGRQLQLSWRWKTYHNSLNPPCNHERITTLNFSNFDFKISIFVKIIIFSMFSLQNLKESLRKYAWKFFFCEKSKYDMISSSMVRFCEIYLPKVLWTRYLVILRMETLVYDVTGVILYD